MLFLRPRLVRTYLLRRLLGPGSSIWRGAVRRCSSLPQKGHSRPPFLIRSALIGVSVTLATPAFTVAGVYRIWAGVLPKSAAGHIVKAFIGIGIGGGCFALIYNFVGPALLDYSDLLLPFALSNGVACMFWQGVGELAFGLEAMSAATVGAGVGSLLAGAAFRGVPLAGAAIGIAASLTAPLLWTPALYLCWNGDLRSFLLPDVYFLRDLYYSVAAPVVIPVGLFSGVALQTVLSPLLMGAPPRPWVATSLPALGVIALACGAFYSSSQWRGTSISAEQFCWVKRLDPHSGLEVSWNKMSGQSVPGVRRAELSAYQRDIVKGFHLIKNSLMQLRYRLFYSTLPPAGSYGDIGDLADLANAENPGYPGSSGVVGAVRGNSGNNGGCTIESIEREAVLLDLLDLLVRRRFLLESAIAAAGASAIVGGGGSGMVGGGGPTLSAKQVQEQLAVLQEKARTMGIDDLALLQREAEMGVVVQRLENEKRSSGSGSGDSEDVHLSMASVLSRLQGAAGSGRGKEAALLLGVNFSSLEESLQRVQYRIPTPSKQQKVQLEAAYAREITVASIKRAILITSMVITLPLAWLYLTAEK